MDAARDPLQLQAKNVELKKQTLVFEACCAKLNGENKTLEVTAKRLNEENESSKQRLAAAELAIMVEKKAKEKIVRESALREKVIRIKSGLKSKSPVESGERRSRSRS